MKLATSRIFQLRYKSRQCGDPLATVICMLSTEVSTSRVCEIATMHQNVTDGITKKKSLLTENIAMA
jgi:hypothetical protein